MKIYTCSCEAYKLEIANLRKEVNRLQDLIRDAWHAERARISGEHIDSRLSKAKSLLREVIAWESNPESPCYNSCDKRPCEWCREAMEIVNE